MGYENTDKAKSYSFGKGNWYADYDSLYKEGKADVTAIVRPSPEGGYQVLLVQTYCSFAGIVWGPWGGGYMGESLQVAEKVLALYDRNYAKAAKLGFNEEGCRKYALGYVKVA